MNTIKDKITASHWCCQPSLISIKDNFDIYLEFYVISLWILHITLNSSSLSLEERKLIAIFNWTFHVSDFLRSFMVSFTYGLTLLRYSSIVSVWLLPPLLLYSTEFLSQKLPISLVSNNLLLHHAQNNISNYSVLVSFIFFFLV